MKLEIKSESGKKKPKRVELVKEGRRVIMIREFLVTAVNLERSMINETSEDILISMYVKRRWMYIFWKRIEPEVLLMNPMWNERARTLTMYQRTSTNERCELVFYYDATFDKVMKRFF